MTVIATPFSLFEFPIIPFGLGNVGQTFRCSIDEILKDLNYCFAYLDHILVFSCSSKAMTKTSVPSSPTPNVLQVRFPPP